MIAVDTNVLIYACDQADPRRQKIALDLITNAQDGVLLWQVACEFLSASRKLSKQGFTPTDAWNRLAEFRDLLPLVLPTDANLARAKELHLARGASLWDALILAACVEAGVETFYSEDLPGFDDFEGLRDRQSVQVRGAEEGDARPRRGWPPPRKGLVPGSPPAPGELAIAEPPQSLERGDVAIRHRSQDGRRFLPPGERPSTGVAAKMGRERPRLRIAKRGPEGASGVAHAPRVSVGDVLGRAPHAAGNRAISDGRFSRKCRVETNSKLRGFDHPQFRERAVACSPDVTAWRSTRARANLQPRDLTPPVSTTAPSLRSRFSGSAWARQGFASPLRALDPPGALPMPCNYRSDGRARAVRFLVGSPASALDRRRRRAVCVCPELRLGKPLSPNSSAVSAKVATHTQLKSVTNRPRVSSTCMKSPPEASQEEGDRGQHSECLQRHAAGSSRSAASSSRALVPACRLMGQDVGMLHVYGFLADGSRYSWATRALSKTASRSPRTP